MNLPGIRYFAAWLGGLLVFGLAGCALPLSQPDSGKGAASGTLLGEVREMTRREGLVVARDFLAVELARRDASKGSIEGRVVQTTKDKGLILPDSLAAMPASQRRRTAIAIIPGTRAASKAGKDRTRECLRGAEAECRAMGFATYFVETEARGTIEENVEVITEQMKEVFASSDSVLILMLSKGAHDVIRYLQEGGADLPASHRNKLVAVLSLAGTVQGSVVAEWVAWSPRPLPSSMRAWLRLSGQDDAIEMLRAVGDSPWREEEIPQMARRYPRLTWVSMAMVPDGPDGRITERLWSPHLRKRVEKSAPYYSPSDGLVETAASVLPDAMAVPQWVVAAYGSHAMPNGTYRDGTRIAPGTTVPGEEKLKPETGGEVISAYLRALPRSLLH